MNRNRLRLRKGFTLVEILIVVVILGILAAIVIPQFSSASESARASNLAAQQQSIRSQLELYRNQNGDVYPSFTDEDQWEQMTTRDNEFGPYLQQAPRNPFSPRANATSVAILSGEQDGLDVDAADHGWGWNPDTQQFFAAAGDLDADVQRALGYDTD